jgi:hypothetical protein
VRGLPDISRHGLVTVVGNLPELAPNVNTCACAGAVTTIRSTASSTVEGEPVKVTCHAAECTLGDKLSAFAPHTTGIL